MFVPEFFKTIEATGLSSWTRESTYGFYYVLLVHTAGLALLVGASFFIDLRLLGVAEKIPLKALKSFYGFIWTGLVISALSGGLLVVSYPTKTLTNLIFYFKMVFIVIGMMIMQRIYHKVLMREDMDVVETGKRLAKYSLIMWFITLTAGRLLAYTAKYLVYGTEVSWNAVHFLQSYL